MITKFTAPMGLGVVKATADSANAMVGLENLIALDWASRPALFVLWFVAARLV